MGSGVCGSEVNTPYNLQGHEFKAQYCSYNKRKTGKKKKRIAG